MAPALSSIRSSVILDSAKEFEAYLTEGMEIVAMPVGEDGAKQSGEVVRLVEDGDDDDIIH